MVPAAVATGVVDPRRLALGSLEIKRADRLRTDIDQLRTAAEVFRSLPSYAAPTELAASVRQWLRADEGDASNEGN